MFDFYPHPVGSGIKATLFFKNGYGVSVVRSPWSYGGNNGLYELAVLKGNDEKADLCYNSGLTNDVIGNITLEEAKAIAIKVSELPDA